jgi:hypothetical protein
MSEKQTIKEFLDDRWGKGALERFEEALRREKGYDPEHRGAMEAMMGRENYERVRACSVRKKGG